MPFDLETFIADCLAVAPDQAAVAEVVRRAVRELALEETFTRKVSQHGCSQLARPHLRACFPRVLPVAPSDIARQHVHVNRRWTLCE
jgi:hypothetical protein